MNPQQCTHQYRREKRLMTFILSGISMLVFPVGHLKFPNSSCLKGISVSLLVPVCATFVVVVERSILSSISFYSPVHWQQRLFYSISTYYITIRVHRHSKITLTFLHTVYLKPLEILILKCKMTVGIMKDYNSESLIYLFSLFFFGVADIPGYSTDCTKVPFLVNDYEEFVWICFISC